VRVNGGSPQNERLLVGFLNAVRPGDFVDVYYSSLEFPPGLPPDVEQREREAHSANYLFTRRLMQNIKVMNIGFFPDAAGKAAETPRDDRYLTLEVTPDQALQLKWIKDVSTFAGNVEFVLRSPLDTQPFPAQTITFDSMSQNYQIGTGR
jgi:Flp pilus assembly protein CpaB